MLYGASYYWEYQPYERLEQDVQLMQDMGLSVARLGESTWSSWEPEDGRFEMVWMDRVIDVLHAAGIKVIFGTPTYAIPPWLHRKHPEIMAQYAHGQRAYYGARQNINLAHPAYLHYAERVIRTLISHFAPHPAIIGFQIDNETSSGQLYNPDVFQKFIQYLKAKYGTVDAINEKWGLTYWSHRLSDWGDLWTPDGDTTPGYNLEWRRFQSALVTEFLTWQTGIVKEYARPDQFVTQDFVGVHNRPESDLYAVAQATDIVSINPYHVTQEGLNLEKETTDIPGAPEWMISRSGDVGVFSLFMNGDWAYGAKEANFLVTELNARSIGGSHTNYPGYDGQLRQVVYALIARGSNMVAYWHWHTLHYGAETYWGGVLGHDLEMGRCAHEFQRIAFELRDHDALLTDLRPDANVGFLYSEDSKYALAYTPALSVPGSNDPDQQTYERIFDAFYRGFFEARAQMTIMHPPQDFEKYALLVVPALYIADDALLERLAQYAHNGGHLLLTFRSGYADEYARARWVRAPGKLRDAVGASYEEYSNLHQPVSLVSGQADFRLSSGAMAEGWADGLLLEGAVPLAHYDHPHFGQFPAITSQPYGQGRVTYCGTLPDRSSRVKLAEWVMKQAGIHPLLPELPSAVQVTTARNPQGQKLWFFFNWSWTPQTLENLSLSGRNLFDKQDIGAGDSLQLDAWDVKVIIQAD